MLIEWSKFLPALLLLLPPMALFHGRRVRYRALAHDWSGHWPRIFSLGLHPIDFGRALLGAWCLTEALATSPGALGFARYGGLLAQAGVLWLATVLQTFVCKEPESANAPFAFIAGLVFGFLPPAIAGLALLLATAVAAGVRIPVLFFPVLAGSIVGIGTLLTQQKLVLQLATVAGVVAMPWLLTLLFPRTLVATHVAKRVSEERFAAGDDLK